LHEKSEKAALLRKSYLYYKRKQGILKSLLYCMKVVAWDFLPKRESKAIVRANASNKM